MKKLTRILSIVMLIAMLMSMVGTSAFALVDDDAGRNNGGVSIGGVQRPSNDSAYSGIRNDEGDDESTTVAPTGKTSAARVASEKNRANYEGKQDNYSGLTDSDLDLVKDPDNNAFLKYIRDYVNDHETLSDEMTKVVQSAVTIFGEEAVYGPSGSSTGSSGNDNNSDEDGNNSEEENNSEDGSLSEEEARLEAMKEALMAKWDELDILRAASEAADAELDALSREMNKNPNLAFDAEYMAKLDELSTAADDAYDAYEACQAEADKMEEDFFAAGGSFESDKPSAFNDDGPAPIIVQSVVPTTQVSSLWKTVCPTSKYNSLAAAVQHREEMVFEKTMDIINSTDYNITLDLNLSNIYVSDDCETAFYIDGTSTVGHDATISFTRGTIYGDGFYVVDGVLNLGGLINAITYPDITIYSETANAVTVNGNNAWVVVAEGATLYGSDSVKENNIAGTIGIWCGNVYVNGGKVFGDKYAAITNYDGNLIIEGSSHIDSANNVGLYLANGGNTSIEDGSVRGITGIAISGTHTLDISGGHVIGDLTYHMPIASGETITGNWELCGNAIAVMNRSSDKESNPIVNVYAENVLLSENNLAIESFYEESGSVNRLSKPDVESMTRVSLVKENCIEQEYIAKTGDWSDYNKAVVTILVDGLTIGYPTLKAAFDAAKAYSGSDDSFTIKLLGDYVIDDAEKDLTLGAPAGKTVIFDGNYKKLTAAEDDDGIEVNNNGGTVEIRNITIKDSHDVNMAGIWVRQGKVEIGDNVSICHFYYGIDVDDGEVLVNDMSVDDASEIGIFCTGGKTTVVMCKINCDVPVYADNTDQLLINGGWFLYEVSQKDETDPKGKVANYIDSKISHIEYVKADKYYEVLLNDTPVVQVVSGETGYEIDGSPYVVFDKGDMEKIIFSVSPEVMTIEAVNVYTGVYKPLFNAPDGKKGNVAIQDSAMKDLPAGKYDLRFTFKTSNYVIKNKLGLYVFPAIATLLNQDLTYNTDYDIVTFYNVGNMKNIAVYMSELPEKIAVGNDPTGVNVTYLENYIKSNPDTWQKNFIRSTNPNRISQIGDNYTYIISYADLNNLASGQNYVFLRYGDDAYCAVERLPLMVYNAAVSISPTAVTWSKINGTLDFTVAPNVQEIYIDDDFVDPGYYTYDPYTGKLSIKGSYFKALKPGDHLMEVITSMGKVAATVRTGAALAPKDVDYHVYGGAKSLSFVASDKIDYDLGITIGSANAVNVDSFIIKDNDSQFTLSANYLNRLALGTYTISAYVLTTDKDGNEVYQKCSTTFRIISASQAAYNPGTGDTFNPVIWIAILVLSAVIILVIILPKLKKSKAAAAGIEEAVETAENIVEEAVEKKE